MPRPFGVNPAQKKPRPTLSEEERRILSRLRNDFEHYASRCLVIRGKDSSQPFRLNRAQQYLHRRIEEQRVKTGRVRALILKGRQQGCSTYVEGRFYWRVSGEQGKRAFILTHEDEATKNLFEMAQRFHENVPEIVRPSTKASNAKELYFNILDSGYRVGTARTKGAGRSGTVQYFHGSEIAHWPNQAEHMAGVMQSIPSGEAGKGTEVILETTANGIGELFYRMWRSAERGISEYQAIFIPWYWQDEYKSPLPEDFEPDDEERQLLAAYAADGLTSEHLQWRRLKIATEFEGEAWLFRQEYPFTASEAFQTSTGKPIIQPRWVLAGRQNTVEYAYGPRILGVDVARQGKDRSAMALRQGRKVHFVEAKHDPDLMSVAGWVMIAIKRFKPHAIFIDETGGYGAAVVDRLRELGQIVIGVQFGGKVDDPDRYRIKRDEIWGEMAAWFAEGGVDVPDDDDLQADLCGPEHTHDSRHRLILESKEKMEDRGLPSPDKGDALALTFSHPVMTDEAMSAGGFAAEPEPVEDY